MLGMYYEVCKVESEKNRQGMLFTSDAGVKIDCTFSLQ